MRLQQQGQGDCLGLVKRQQPQEANRTRGGLLQAVERQRPAAGHRLGVSAGLAPGQQLSPALPEQSQVPNQGAHGGLDIRGCLLQRQRQPAQLVSEVPGRLSVLVTRAVDQESRRDVPVEHRNI